MAASSTSITTIDKKKNTFDFVVGRSTLPVSQDHMSVDAMTHMFVAIFHFIGVFCQSVNCVGNRYRFTFDTVTLYSINGNES